VDVFLLWWFVGGDVAAGRDPFPLFVIPGIATVFAIIITLVNTDWNEK